MIEGSAKGLLTYIDPAESAIGRTEPVQRTTSRYKHAKNSTRPEFQA